MAQGDYTKWSIVYDLPARRIHWRTLGNLSLRHVDLSAFDFSCSSPVKVLDIDEGHGSVAARFADYTPETNRSLVERSFRKTDFLGDARRGDHRGRPPAGAYVLRRGSREAVD